MGTSVTQILLRCKKDAKQMQIYVYTCIIVTSSRILAVYDLSSSNFPSSLPKSVSYKYMYANNDTDSTWQQCAECTLHMYV